MQVRLSRSRTFRRLANLGVAGGEVEGGHALVVMVLVLVLVQQRWCFYVGIKRSWEVGAVVAEAVVEEADGWEVKFGGEDAKTGADEKNTKLLVLATSLRLGRASGGRTVFC